MNKNRLKSYAPAARREFIQAVMDRAALLGLSEDRIEPIEVRGDFAFIDGRPYPKAIAEQRKRLEERIKLEGFSQVMEEMAYTWFNRFTALRYMEIHGYLEHGMHVLSNPNGSHIPEILEKAERVELPGVKREEVIEMKLAGTRDAELYRKLLVAQCNALSTAMPFLFEYLNDDTELLLPDNLLHTSSMIRKLVTEIDEEDWREVEIVGWLYQFYISEKKDEVIGKVVKSEDIPAATQLFTPNWIVKYMVQNSLGRMWLTTYPNSGLRRQMEYYIEPAEQTEEVKAQLAAITPTQIDPETITLLDPACGSGHILVEAYDLLKEIYIERGYRRRDIPKLILEKNLYGLDIDDRAAQLAGFALLMKARGDDSRILEGDAPRMNVMAIQSSEGIDAIKVAEALLPIRKTRVVGHDMLFAEMETQQVIEVVEPGKVSHGEVIELLKLFENGKTFGSLITIDEEVAGSLEQISKLVNGVIESREMLSLDAAKMLLPFVRQAEVLSKKFDCVVANPPYMGNKYLNSALKNYLKNNYNGSEKDTFAAFIVRDLALTKENGYLGFVMPFVWMFNSSFEELRQQILSKATITSLIQLEYNAFEPACVPVCTFTMQDVALSKFKGEFIKLSEFTGHQNQAPRTLEAINNPNCGWRFQASVTDFKKIPGSPIAYWVTPRYQVAFELFSKVSDLADLKAGMSTGNNNIFQRYWFEVSIKNIGFNLKDVLETINSIYRWYPCNSGGTFRKWYGNNEIIVDWENNGYRIRNFGREDGSIKSAVRNDSYYFKRGITWSKISSSNFSARYNPGGFLFDDIGRSGFCEENILNKLVGFLCSKVAHKFLTFLSPSLSFTIGELGNLPFNTKLDNKINFIASEAVNCSKTDWDSFETSWDFQHFPLLTTNLKSSTVEASFLNWQSYCTAQIKRMQELETENNRLFIEAYGLQDEMSPEVPEDQITLARADREADIKRLISYAIGCTMGRYSLDQPGLVYAQSGNEGFDPAKYKTFPADEDGIVPILDTDWFADDAANRVIEFIKVAWSPKTLEENLKFIADSLSAKQGEAPRDTIRRYLSTQFYKDHIQTYKKRPIYWLFSSGKQRAFECLVYLHRYNESILSRMRNEYVTPLHGKLAAQAEYLKNEVAAATSTAARNKLQKQLDTLKKKQAELKEFDDQLRHYADKRIKLDLDDGVKVNYGKFGPLLAEARTIAAESEG